MVEFGTGYFQPMDREYSQHGHIHEAAAPAQNSTNDVGVSIGEFGMSAAVGPVPNVQALGAKVRGGSKTLEIVFTGYGKGSGQGQTPEMYGKLQRQALEELGKANRVNWTTHSTVGVYGLAGMDQQGNFSKTSKNMSLQEIKRAIEFAADIGRGGPVVVHTGEFQRPVVDAEWNQKNDSWKGKFRMYEDEEGRTSYRVVDSRTGGAIDEARKNRKVTKPIWKRYQSSTEYEDEEWKKRGGKEYSDENGQVVKPGDYIDYFGNKVDPAQRVPVFDAKEGHFLTHQMSWEELKKEAQELTERAQKFWRENKSKPKEVWEKDLWLRFKDAQSEDEVQVRPEEAYIIATLETNAAHARGWALQYGGDFDEDVANYKKLKKAKEFYTKIEEATSEEERWKLKKQFAERYSAIIPPEEKFPSEHIEKEMKQLRHRMEQSREAASSQWVQAEQAMETIRHVESAETYALREAYDSYAQAALVAMRHSQKLAQEGKLKKPIAVALENLFPESYGAHPDELIKLVEGSRKRMQEILRQQGVAEEEAKLRSVQHITSTFDTGHLNMWRKYWHGDPQKTLKENDEGFNTWMLTKIGEMVKKGIIGHVHIDDNYGYHDDHLAPGEGNTPIKEMIKIIKDSGYKGELIVEPGADYTTDVSGFHSVMKTWKLFGSPVYGAGSGFVGKRSWRDVGYGFFGQTQPPYFVFGAYSPSEDWTLWSGVPLE